MYLLCSAVYTVTSLDQHHVHTSHRLMLSDAYTVFVFSAIESRSFFVLWIIDGDIQRDGYL